MLPLMLSTALAQPDVFRFESGFRVVVDHQPGIRWAATAMVFDSGEGDVPSGQEHLAHLLEHVWYRGGDDASRMATYHALGCEAQAYTWPRSTAFLATCPADVLGRQLDLEVAHLTGVLDGVSDSDVALERDIVAIEVGAYRQSPLTAVFDIVASHLDPDPELRDRLARRGLGGELDLGELQARARQTWTADHAVLAIVSPVPGDELRPLLQSRFGPIVSLATAGPPPPAPPGRRRTLRVDVRTVDAPVEIPVATLSWELPLGILADATSLVSWLEAALALRIGQDARFTGLGCGTNLAASTPLLTCIVGVHEGVSLEDATRSLRAGADVRDDVSRALVAEATRESIESRLVDAMAGSDALAPEPFNRPARRAYEMLRTNRVVRPQLPDRPKRRALKALTRAVTDAFDPQRALAMAVVPRREPTRLPEARPAPGPGIASPQISVPAPVTATAPTRDIPGGIAVLRPDLQFAHVLTFETGSWNGSAVETSTTMDPDDVRRRVYIGPDWPLGATDGDDQAWFAQAWGDRGAAPSPASLVPVSVRCPVDGHDDAARVVAREILEHRGWIGLRERTAWTYAPEVWLDPAGLRLHAAVLPDAAAPARELLAAAFAKPVDARELAVARRRASVRGSTAYALPSHWAELFVARDGLRPSAVLEGLPSAVAAVSGPEVDRLLATCAVIEMTPTELPSP